MWFCCMIILTGSLACKNNVTFCFHDFVFRSHKSQSLSVTNQLIKIHIWPHVCYLYNFFSLIIFTLNRHHTVTRGITKGVKEDFRLAMERQVSRCGENLLTVLHRFCINEKIIIIQSLPWQLARDCWTFLSLIFQAVSCSWTDLMTPKAVAVSTQDT